MPKPPRFSPNPVRVIDVLAFPAVQLLDVTGPVQVFASANDLIAVAGGTRAYELRVVAQGGEGFTASAGVTLAAGPLSKSDEPLDTLLIAGGEGKNQDFAPLARAFRGKVRHVSLIGRDAPLIAAALSGVCTMERCATLGEAVQAAARAARPGDTVLLSPACASFDMFRDYTHRGAVFAEAVQELAA